MADELSEIASKLGLNLQQLGDVPVLVLPENACNASASSQLYDADDSIILVKQFRSLGVPCKTAYDLGIRSQVMDRRGADVWLGVIWLFLENGLFPLAVNVMSEWVIAKLVSKNGTGEQPTSNGRGTVHVELHLQEKDRVSTLKFDGSADSFASILSALKELGEHRQ